MYMTKVATRTAAKLPSSRKIPTIGAAWVVLGAILEQAGQQGLPEIQAFATPARKNLKKSSRALKKSVSGRGPRKKRRAPGEIRKICNQTVENHGLLGAGNRRFSMKIVGNSRVGVVSRRIL